MTANSTRSHDVSLLPSQTGEGRSPRPTRAARIRRIALLVILAELVVFGIGFAVSEQHAHTGHMAVGYRDAVAVG